MSPDNTRQPDQVSRLLWIIANLVEKTQKLEAELLAAHKRELYRKQANQ